MGADETVLHKGNFIYRDIKCHVQVYEKEYVRSNRITRWVTCQVDEETEKIDTITHGNSVIIQHDNNIFSTINKIMGRKPKCTEEHVEDTIKEFKEKIDRILFEQKRASTGIAFNTNDFTTEFPKE